MNETTHRRRTRTILLSVLLVTLGLIVIGFFGRGVIRSFRDVRDVRPMHFAPSTTDPSTIRGWMSLRYVSMSYGVPADALRGRLPVSIAPEQDKIPLRQLNDTLELGTVDGVPTLVRSVTEAVQALRKQSPPPKS